MSALYQTVHRWWRQVVLATVIALTLIGFVGAARSDAAPFGMRVSWWSVDGGGGTISGGAYRAQSTIGQPDAGTLRGGSYTLDAGFLHGQLSASQSQHVYLPMTRR